MKQLTVIMALSLDYLGPISMAIAGVFCLSLIIYTLHMVNEDIKADIAKHLRPMAETNPYVEYYMKNQGFTILTHKRDKTKARNAVRNRKYATR